MGASQLACSKVARLIRLFWLLEKTSQAYLSKDKIALIDPQTSSGPCSEMGSDTGYHNFKF
eukprot:6479399-Amphidinium_carterae.3